MPYNDNDYYNMTLCLGKAWGNVNRAIRIYRRRFNPVRVPHRRVFINLINRLRQPGHLAPQRRDRGDAGNPAPAAAAAVRLEERVLQQVNRDPTTSTRSVARHCGTNQSRVWKILNKENLHPYHYRKVQELSEIDYPRRVEFSRWMLEQDDEFLRNVMWTDESQFTRDGIFNQHNQHYWAAENPRLVRKSSFQHRWSVNVWAGLHYDQLIGPIFLPPRMNALVFTNFLNGDFQEIMDAMPLQRVRNMWLQLDGAPAHYSREVRVWLNREFPQRWIGRGGPVAWPPRSPDLTPVDFFVWSFIKEEVYATECPDANTMRERIVVAFDELKLKVDILRGVTRSLHNRARWCIQQGGAHFEQYLQ